MPLGIISRKFMQNLEVIGISKGVTTTITTYGLTFITGTWGALRVFSESLLADGAGGEQIASDSLRKLNQMILPSRKGEETLKGPHRSEGVDGLRAWDDAPDRISINIGIELFNEHPSGAVTAKMIMDKVLAVKIDEWGENGVREHVCKSDR